MNDIFNNQMNSPEKISINESVFTTDLIKRVGSNAKTISKWAAAEGVGNTHNIGLVRAVIWKIFGFAEANISEFATDLLGVSNSGEIQYLVELCAPGSLDGDMLNDRAGRTASEKRLRYFVQTDGINWAIFEADAEAMGAYRFKASATMTGINSSDVTYLESLKPFCSERHAAVVWTDPSNRKRWYGFWDEESERASKMFLVEFIIYEDLTERVHVPFLNVTIWGDKPFAARSKAWAFLEEYCKKTATTVSKTFETIAFRGEHDTFKENVKIQRESLRADSLESGDTESV